LCFCKYTGRYFGNRQELNGVELDEFLFNTYGETWERLVVPNVQTDDLENSAFRVFREKAIGNDRLSAAEANVPNRTLLANLKLLDGEELTNAAVLLFHHDPEIVSFGAYVKIAYFIDNAEFKFQDIVRCPIIEMPDKVLDLVYSKYFKGIVSYDGWQRIEHFPIPRDAFCEAILNAIIHKNYRRQVPIQIKIYDDKVIIYNAAKLPKNWTIEKLSEQHESCPYNPLIAETFFRVGYIEAWGRGIERINSALNKAGLPNAKYSLLGDTMSLVFEIPDSTVNDTVNDTVKLTRTQKEIISQISNNGNLTALELSKMIHKGIATVKVALKVLQEKGIIIRIGSDKSGHWEVVG
jgi:ATP-dependent DNA helicase RecG